jgi:hypothetical protein
MVGYTDSREKSAPRPSFHCIQETLHCHLNGVSRIGNHQFTTCSSCRIHRCHGRHCRVWHNCRYYCYRWRCNNICSRFYLLVLDPTLGFTQPVLGDSVDYTTIVLTPSGRCPFSSRRRFFIFCFLCFLVFLLLFLQKNVKAFLCFSTIAGFEGFGHSFREWPSTPQFQQVSLRTPAPVPLWLPATKAEWPALVVTPDHSFAAVISK